jgi:hypothetical protein
VAWLRRRAGAWFRLATALAWWWRLGLLRWWWWRLGVIRFWLAILDALAGLAPDPAAELLGVELAVHHHRVLLVLVLHLLDAVLHCSITKF